MVSIPHAWLLALARAVELTGLGASRLEVCRLDVPVPDLPADLDGFCIAQVSDLHAGEGAWGPHHCQEAVDAMRAADPDVVINTGDFLQWEPAIERVGRVASGPVLPYKERAQTNRNIAILGNHDYHPGQETAQKLRLELESVGIRVLENDGVCIPRGRAAVSFIGLTADAPGWDQGIERLLAATHPRIALVHTPDSAEYLPRDAADLVLAGHTHGGQCTLPGLESWVAWKFARTRYVAGMYSINDMPVYVNRGLGTTGLPLRFRARPELTLLRLVR